MRFNPPYTNDAELNQFLLELSRYVSDLGVDSSRTVDPMSQKLVFTERYLHVKFALDNVGTGFGGSQINQLYFGLYNSSSATESVTFSDYQWYPSTFGIINKLWYKNLGNRSIQFFVGVAAPDSAFAQVTVPSIDLDAIAAVIPDYSVTNIKLVDDSVDSRVLAVNAVEKENIADNAVGEAELDATGTPAVDTFLNGLMQWVKITPGLFLEQTIVENEERYLTETEAAGHHYHPASDANTVTLSIPNTALYSYPVGTTYTFINMSAQPIIIRSDNATLEALDGTGTVTYAYNVNTASKVTMIYVATGKWVYSVDGGTATVVTDPGPPDLGEADYNFTADAYVDYGTLTGDFEFT